MIMIPELLLKWCPRRIWRLYILTGMGGGLKGWIARDVTIFGLKQTPCLRIGKHNIMLLVWYNPYKVYEIDYVGDRKDVAV